MENVNVERKLQAFGCKKRKVDCQGKLGFLTLAAIILVLPMVSASVRINEVMPHPTNQYEEWVELYNSGDNDLLFNGIIGDDQSNDTITNLTIKSKSFALIVDDAIGCSGFDIPGESCIEFASIGGYGLKNGGERLNLYDNMSKIEDYTWTSDPGVNISIGRCPGGSEWQLCDAPTPGKANVCPAETECGDDNCSADEDCVNCPEDCLDKGKVCCDNISYSGDCCSDDDCSGEETCESNVCTPLEPEPEVNEISYNITLPIKIVSEEEFIVKVEINNNQNKSQDFEVWSYVYISSKCYSCYWGKIRESNKQNVSLNARSLKAIELEDKVNASEGKYKLKIKILREGILTPLEFTYDVNVTNKEISGEEGGSTSELSNETMKEDASAAKFSSDETAPTFSILNNGKGVVIPKDEKIHNVSIYLFTGTLIVAVMYLAKLRFLN
ncbi:MAG: hypothetical protein KKE23_04380 [Nanoarchaeota archaeon]|nr:hypothetical protein [Nanoarchaeota archaeon]